MTADDQIVVVDAMKIEKVKRLSLHLNDDNGDDEMVVELPTIPTILHEKHNLRGTVTDFANDFGRTIARKAARNVANPGGKNTANDLGRTIVRKAARNVDAVKEIWKTSPMWIEIAEREKHCLKKKYFSEIEAIEVDRVVDAADVAVDAVDAGDIAAEIDAVDVAVDAAAEIDAVDAVAEIDQRIDHPH